MKSEMARGGASDATERPKVPYAVIGYTRGSAEWGIHLADNGHLPQLPPLTDEFKFNNIVKENDLLRRDLNRRDQPELTQTSPWSYEDIEVEIDVASGNVALIGTLEKERFHVDPETTMPISEGHQPYEFPDVKSLSVGDLALKGELDGDMIEKFALYLLGDKVQPVQWAPRTAYRKNLSDSTQENKTSTSEAEAKPTYAELTPMEKREHLIDALGAVSTTIVEEDIHGASHKEITDVLGYLIGELDVEEVAIEPQRLQEGASRASETTWKYVEAAFEEAKQVEGASTTVWEARGMTRPSMPSIEFAESLLPTAKQLFLEKRAKDLEAQDTTKFRHR